MEKYAVMGGNPLRGEVEIGGAKNAALAIVAAAVMTDETVLIENLPDVSDVNVLLEAMESAGVIINRIDRHTVKINGSQIKNLVVDNDSIKKFGEYILVKKDKLYSIYDTNGKRISDKYYKKVDLERNTLKVLPIDGDWQELNETI